MSLLILCHVVVTVLAFRTFQSNSCAHNFHLAFNIFTYVLLMVREEDIKAWRDYNDLYFLQCACKFTEACATTENEENLSKRKEIKELIATLKKVNPYVEGNIFKSVENVNLDTVVAYKSKGEKHHFLDTYDEKSEEQGE